MKSMRKTLPILSALVLSLPSAGATEDTPSCRNIQSRFSLQLFGGPDSGCTSDIGQCAVGEYHGSLRGESEFVATSFGPTEDPDAGFVAVLTGDNVIHTPSGDIWTKDAIILAVDGGGEFAELDTVVGGTGDFEGATGRLIGTGSLVGANGTGMVSGEICWP